MRGIPLAYTARNLWVRRVTTLLTAGGMALVVFVFTTVLMMSEGIRTALVTTGQPDNVLLLRKGAGAEINSGIDRASAALVESLPGVALDIGGRPLVSKEPVLLSSLPRRDSGKAANVTLRGTRPEALQLRPQVGLLEGRLFRPGTSEIVVGRSVARGFRGIDLGASLRMAGRDWVIVGILDGSGSAFDSEIWGDAEQMLQAFRRVSYSTIVLRLADPGGFERLKAAVEADPRLTLEAKPEQRFYAEQSEVLVNFITILGLTLAVIFSIGAVVGSMITMFAAVASRTGEIGTLRALGFRQGAVLTAFLLESLLLAAVGGAAGLAAATVLTTVDIATTNFQTFAELAFRFVLTPRIARDAMLFALAMGLVGGFIPAWRAARLNIVDSLRSA